MKLLVTGSHGLLGSEVVEFFCKKGWEVIGLDNDNRGRFFGVEGSTRSVGERLQEIFPTYKYLNIDITDYVGLGKVFFEFAPFDFIIHAAAQPSHVGPIKDFGSDYTNWDYS